MNKQFARQIKTYVNLENIEEDDDVFRHYIITESGYKFLSEYTDEIVYYHDGLDMYVWRITNFGTGLDYVFN